MSSTELVSVDPAPKLPASLDGLADYANDRHQEALGHAQSAAIQAAEAGAALLEAKKMVGHGRWERWVEINCGFGLRTSQVYMQAAKALARLGPESAECCAFGDKSLRQALVAISEPKPVAEEPAPSDPIQPPAEPATPAAPIEPGEALPPAPPNPLIQVAADASDWQRQCSAYEHLRGNAGFSKLGDDTARTLVKAYGHAYEALLLAGPVLKQQLGPHAVPVRCARCGWGGLASDLRDSHKCPACGEGDELEALL